jgi:YesN/AraC family two-component response regulator
VVNVILGTDSKSSYNLGYPSLQNAVEAVKKGADGYILKPANMTNLLAIMRQHLEKQEQEFIEKGDSPRGRTRYCLTMDGVRFLRFMDFLRTEQIVSEEIDLRLPRAFHEDNLLTTKLKQAGFSVEDWETAISCGLISEKRETVLAYAEGRSIDPSKKYTLPPTYAIQYTYSIN